MIEKIISWSIHNRFFVWVGIAMKPITIPFVFGLMSAILFVLIVLPVIYQIVKERELKRHGKVEVLQIKD